VEARPQVVAPRVPGPGQGPQREGAQREPGPGLALVQRPAAEQPAAVLRAEELRVRVPARSPPLRKAAGRSLHHTRSRSGSLVEGSNGQSSCFTISSAAGRPRGRGRTAIKETFPSAWRPIGDERTLERRMFSFCFVTESTQSNMSKSDAASRLHAAPNRPLKEMLPKRGPEQNCPMRNPSSLSATLKSLSRRALLSASALWLGASFLGCSKKDEAPSAPAASAAESATKPAAEPGALTVGFIYVGPKDDYGYNQAHHEGAAAVSKLAGIKIREEEKVPETMDVQKTMESMINLDGAKLLFPTSFGYFDPHILKIAEKYPDVTFLHCGGLYTEGKHPKNVGSYFGYIDEAQYVAGVVAGGTTKTNKLGFIAAKPIPQVLRNINSFTLGALSVNPKIETTVIFTGDWAMPVKEAEAANSLADQGVDVLTCHVDSPKVVIETAEKRGIFSSGYHASQATLAPKGYLTGAEWNWEKVYSAYIEKIKKGEKPEHLVRGGFSSGYIKMSPYGAAVSAEIKTKADEAKQKLTDGSLVIYQGPLKDNTGKEIIAAGAKQAQTDIALESMNYLVAGVKGKLN
jgi:simple sugar transport system substrate-binding protein